MREKTPKFPTASTSIGNIKKHIIIDHTLPKKNIDASRKVDSYIQKIHKTLSIIFIDRKPYTIDMDVRNSGQ